MLFRSMKSQKFSSHSDIIIALLSCADTFFGGSISRDQVAEVAVDSCLFKEGANKIVEIVATADARQVTTQQGLESVR